MKRIGTIVIILIILYSTYYDLTIGTLPNHLTQAANQPTNEQATTSLPEDGASTLPTEQLEPYQEVIVEPGHTVLTIVEHLHEGPIPASIQEIVYDFKQLNNGLEPEDMQIGETYLFPLYH